jgi:hypothetical protein
MVATVWRNWCRSTIKGIGSVHDFWNVVKAKGKMGEQEIESLSSHPPRLKKVILGVGIPFVSHKL